MAGQEEALKMRISNFEALRIISMMMIILFHIQQNVASEESTFYKAAVRSVGVWGGVVGVTCFVMIFSWFSLEQEKNYNIIFKKAKKTIFQTVQYMIFFSLYS